MLLLRFLVLYSAFEDVQTKFFPNEELNTRTVSSIYYCDNTLITLLQSELSFRRKTNKYLRQKLEHFKALSENVTENPEKNKECPQRVTYSSCTKAVKIGGDGIYLIQPPLNNIEPYMAVCQKAANEGELAWTVIQRRVDNQIDFNCVWEKYQKGFGDLSRSFWFGLDKLYAITHNLAQELLIELTDQEDEKASVKYSHFAIGGPQTNYTLMVLGKSMGNRADALRAHEGNNFATKDRLNEANKSCLDLYTGGWWYGGSTCGLSNLNANFSKNYWKRFKQDEYEFSEIKMSIRPIGKFVH